MPKFYATCGSHTLVVIVPTAQQAAMRLIDETMAAHVWIYEDESLSAHDRRAHVVLEALMHLGTSVAVSERGLGRCDSGSFEVPELLEEWHRLMTAISQMFSAAGLSTCRVLPQALDDLLAPQLPR